MVVLLSDGDAGNIPGKSLIVRSLIGSGFTWPTAETAPNYLMIQAERTEQFGVKVPYLFAFTSCRINSADTSTLVQEAEERRAALVIVGEAENVPDGVSLLSYDQFFDRLGGPIFSLLPFDPLFLERLIILGDNKLPDGLKGKPDDLFEEYVHAGLQFLFRSRVIRHGQDRRGEPVPDGVAVGRSAPLLLYDAKAAGGGYDMSMTAVRQFADYIVEFHRQYEPMFGRLTAFLVVSGCFEDDAEALAERHYEVMAKSQTPLSFITAETLGGIVARLVQRPLFRQTVNWRRVFARPVARLSDVDKELTSRAKDGLVAKAKD